MKLKSIPGGRLTAIAVAALALSACGGGGSSSGSQEEIQPCADVTSRSQNCNDPGPMADPGSAVPPPVPAPAPQTDQGQGQPPAPVAEAPSTETPSTEPEESQDPGTPAPIEVPVVTAPDPDPEPSSVAQLNRYASGDRPDEVTGNQVHIIYVVPGGGVDYQRDLDPRIYRSINIANQWWYSQTNGQKQVRYDTFQGKLDITFHQLPSGVTDSYLDNIYSSPRFKRDALEDYLDAAGYNSPSKKYLVLYEGTHQYSCGDAPQLDGGDSMAVLYLQTGCYSSGFADNANQAPRYVENIINHELIHAFGAVHHGAGNYVSGSHTNVDNDIMGVNYLGFPNTTYRLDPAGTNYFNPASPSILAHGGPNLWYSPYLKDARRVGDQPSPQ